MSEPQAQPMMSADDARERFGDAIDGALPEAEREAFEALLLADAELREEYEGYRAIVRGVSAAAPRLADAEAGLSGEAAPSLVPLVQERIRRRSKGRFFRDRFSSGQAKGAGLTALLLAAALLLLLAVWLMLDNVEVLSP